MSSSEVKVIGVCSRSSSDMGLRYDATCQSCLHMAIHSESSEGGTRCSLHVASGRRKFENMKFFLNVSVHCLWMITRLLLCDTYRLYECLLNLRITCIVIFDEAESAVVTFRRSSSSLSYLRLLSKLSYFCAILQSLSSEATFNKPQRVQNNLEDALTLRL